MADLAPEFEQTDVLGQTLNINGVATSVAEPFPAIPNGQISRLLIKNLLSNGPNQILYISFDGSTFFSMSRGEFLEWTPRKTASNAPIEQIFVRSNTGSVGFESIMDFDL